MLTDSWGTNTIKHQYLLADCMSLPAGWSAATTSWRITWPCCGSAWSSSGAARASQRSRCATWSRTGRTPTCGTPPCRGRWSSSSRCMASAAEAGEAEEEGVCDQEMKEAEMKLGLSRDRGQWKHHNMEEEEVKRTQLFGSWLSEMKRMRTSCEPVSWLVSFQPRASISHCVYVPTNSLLSFLHSRVLQISQLCWDEGGLEGRGLGGSHCVQVAMSSQGHKDTCGQYGLASQSSDCERKLEYLERQHAKWILHPKTLCDTTSGDIMDSFRIKA